jgi:hypothetical protein
MKTERRDGSTEKDVTVAMCVSDEVLAQVAPRWTAEGLLKSPWANVVGSWCVAHFREYGVAPKSAVVAHFREWRIGKDKDTVEAVETFLGELSGRYERAAKDVNAKFVLDLAKRVFNRVAAERMIEAMQADLELNKVEKALDRVAKFGRVEVGSSALVDFFHDAPSSFSAMSEKRESLVKYPGPLGRFFGDELERDAFVAFLGPMKRGKTWWLIDIAWRAVLQRRRVAFFEVGDLSKNQILRRLNVRAALRPLKPTPPDKPLKWPTAIEVDEEGKNALVQFEEKRFVNGLTPQEAEAARLRVLKQRVKSDEPYLQVSTHPNRSITVGGVRAELDDLVRRGWIPDVVVIDYADILKPPPGYSESRDAVNANWMEMRRMSQELHCCVVTATQANAASFKADRLEMSHFAEDNRKFAHVTAMYGINQTTPQKANQVQRLNALVVREDEFVTTNEVWVAGCLGLASPTVVSCLG